MEFPKKYDFKVVETKILKFWEDNQIFKFDSNCTENIFSIDTPPPTVSGKMHMGHAFGYSMFDFIGRYKRMRGFNVFYPFGTDDNGLPTKLLIEKTKKVKSSKMSREDFIKLCLETLKNELRPKYILDFKRIGLSCDFDLNYTTIDKHSRIISQKSFLDLYKQGREYRAEAPSMYCPKCQTAISQVECEDKEFNSSFNDIIFKSEDEDLIIATTRPELLPACVAVFYNPSDKRYKHLNGKKAKVPVFDFEVPILEDIRADPEKGTGLVMCCTFGDQTDMEWQKAHQLPIREAIGKDGRMTRLAGKYSEMKIIDARKEIIKDMKEANLLIKEEPITHAVNVHERCSTPVELIHSKQWFIRYLDLKEDLLDWGEELNWFPNHMKNRFDNWAKGLAWDWCISRQIPFGIPFPVWYCNKCDEVITANEEDLPVDPLVNKPPVDKCPKCQGTEFRGEKDIINTWATSSLTPEISKELVKGTPCYKELVDKPMSFRPQGHDIITFWLFNTVVKSRLHHKRNPWNDCFIHGWALDPKGKKMSKSKGNAIEPQIMIDKYSSDALRYWAAGSKLGDDVPFQEKDLVTGQKTINKLWNASKFVMMHLEDYELKKPDKLESLDFAYLLKLNQVIINSTKYFDEYEYSKARTETELFFWKFCDNYLEIVKDRLYNPDQRGEQARLSGQYTLYHILKSLLKLFAPIMPFVTEEIYSYYFLKKEQTKSIHLTEWPDLSSNEFVKDTSKSETETMRDLMKIVDFIIDGARKFKSENQLSMKEELSIAVIKSPSWGRLGEQIIPDLKAVTKIQNFEISKGELEIKIIK